MVMVNNIMKTALGLLSWVVLFGLIFLGLYTMGGWIAVGITTFCALIVAFGILLAVILDRY